MKILKVLSELDMKDTEELRKRGTVNIPEDIDKIDKNAFASAYNLNEITIPANVKEIENHAFYSCINLKTIRLCGAPVIQERAFENCPSIEEVILTENVYAQFNYTPASVDKYTSFLSRIVNSKAKIVLEYETFLEQE